mmetsp:Transcript_7578/g.17321  ORF Transcript_7578/g.17321 Transcript_7578/m.17321 type:complete len:216 (-) Transcript_7578:294-941(-)
MMPPGPIWKPFTRRVPDSLNWHPSASLVALLSLPCPGLKPPLLRPASDKLNDTLNIKGPGPSAVPSAGASPAGGTPASSGPSFKSSERPMGRRRPAIGCEADAGSDSALWKTETPSPPPSPPPPALCSERCFASASHGAPPPGRSSASWPGSWCAAGKAASERWCLFIGVSRASKSESLRLIDCKLRLPCSSLGKPPSCSSNEKKTEERSILMLC